MLYSEEYNGEFLFIKSQKSLKAQQDKLEYWNGVILKAEASGEITDIENRKNYIKENFLKLVSYLFLISLGVLVLLPFFVLPTMTHNLLLLTAIGGSSVGYFLVAKDLDVKYKAVESFCGATRSVNCDLVLQSDYSTLFGRIKISDVVLSYFLFQLLTLGVFVVFSNNSASYIMFLTVLNILTIPASIVSLYYQYMKIESWCMLCLLVVAFIGIQSGLFLYGYYENYFVHSGINLNALIISVLLFTFIISSVLLIKNKFKSMRESKKNEIQASRLKLDPMVFTHLLYQEKQVDVSTMDHEMIIGEKEAPIHLVTASNLFCKPCKEQHKELDDLLNTYPNNVSLFVRLLPINEDYENKINPWEYLMSYWIQFIHGKQNESERTLNLINDWYLNQNIKIFMDKYTMDNKKSGDKSILTKIKERQIDWIKKSKITKTPAIYLNGFEYPNRYTLEDLKSIVPSLIDFMENEEFQHGNRAYSSKGKEIVL